jgi:glycine dehydrogenase subunit 2
MNMKEEKLLFELSSPGRECASLPEPDVPATPLPPDLARGRVGLPELDELTLVRHFTRLSQKNYSIDTQLYPLGSCTMKYNPKVNEQAAALPGWRDAHPLAGDEFSQGALELIHKLQEQLRAIGGFAAGSLQPAAGAHGELAGVLVIRAWHRSRGDEARRIVLVPDSAHGTNPASCTMAGLKTRTIPSDADGGVDMAALKDALAETGSGLAGLMITNPNTLGLFDRNIEEICRLVHVSGGLVYGDGANMNALVGVLRPADLGIDVMHYNLHKTFSTPHGGGGPGAGFVGVRADLADFLPGPIVVKADGPIVTKAAARGGTAPSGGALRDGVAYRLFMPSRSIGRLKAFYGNFGILVRAYVYLRMLGGPGLRRLSENAVLNANYLRALVEGAYPVKYPRRCMHEFVAQGDIAEGVHTLDVAKRLIDLGFHPPTIYFPLIVPEALMIEPTETESKESLDEFAEALLRIAREAKAEPELLHAAPVTTPVGRLDEVAAARNPVLCHKD